MSIWKEVKLMPAGQLRILGLPGIEHGKNPSLLGGSVARFGSRLTRLFGCRHNHMSRPFSHQGQAYRTCLSCGADRKFNLDNWETQGDFYYRLPTSKYFRALNGLSANTGSFHAAGAK